MEITISTAQLHVSLISQKKLFDVYLMIIIFDSLVDFTNFQYFGSLISLYLN